MASPERPDPSSGRVLTIPNLISLLRLACVPVFVWLLFGPHEHRVAAAELLAVLGVTDWVDGWIARHHGQVSTLGKVLDPTADRVLLAVAVVALLLDGALPTWVAWAAIVREVGVSIGVVALAAAGARRIEVQWAGKAGTFGLMVAFPLFLASHAPDLGWHRLAGTLAWWCAIPGLALGWYAAVTYVPLGRMALREGRVGSVR
ncbi:MAG: CDP-alcohol phosphatidyltransferase family protein [Acidimicrobiales bacterium]